MFRRFCIIVLPLILIGFPKIVQVYETGDIDAGIWSAGIAVGLIRDIPSCEELLRRFEREAEEIIDGLVQMKSSSAKAKL